MKFILAFSILIYSYSSFTQTNIRVMNYNILNFPYGIDSRQDTLEVILAYDTPDLLMVQELKSSTGLIKVVDAINNVSTDNYVSGTYVSQQSNPSSSYKLMQNIVYNTNVFGLAYEEVIITPYRDVNYFKLFLKDENLVMGGDTTYLHTFTTHLKSSQGSSNEQKRLQMAEVMREAINNLPPNSYIICGGDFNLYTSTEPAYEHLLENNVITNRLIDPIDMPGNWHDSSFPNKEILTQSTRLNSLSDGAGGGLDDRFDFVLHSENLADATSDIYYLGGTYNSLGNNGSCYNQDLLDCSTVNNVPTHILSALYHFSDHLPVVFTLKTEITLTVSEEIALQNLSIFPNPANNTFKVEYQGTESLKIYIFDLTGKQIGEGNTNEEINISNLKPGIYSVAIAQNETNLKIEKLIIY